MSTAAYLRRFARRGDISEVEFRPGPGLAGAAAQAAFRQLERWGARPRARAALWVVSSRGLRRRGFVDNALLDIAADAGVIEGLELSAATPSNDVAGVYDHGVAITGDEEGPVYVVVKKVPPFPPIPWLDDSTLVALFAVLDALWAAVAFDGRLLPADVADQILGALRERRGARDWIEALLRGARDEAERDALVGALGALDEMDREGWSWPRARREGGG